MDTIDFIIEKHKSVNQKYDGHDYSLHLKAVAAQARKWANVVQLDAPDKSIVELAAWGHDLIEDTRMTYNDVVDIIGQLGAEIVFACTESTGRSRAERHDDVFFARLTANPLGVFVKLCDLIANTLYGKLTVSSMAKVYEREWPHYKEKLADYMDRFAPMFQYLDKLHNLD